MSGIFLEKGWWSCGAGILLPPSLGENLGLVKVTSCARALSLVYDRPMSLEKWAFILILLITTCMSTSPPPKLIFTDACPWFTKRPVAHGPWAVREVPSKKGWQPPWPRLREGQHSWPVSILMLRLLLWFFGDWPVAFTLCLNTAFLEALAWACILLDVHNVLRNGLNPYTWNQPMSFLKTGDGRVACGSFCWGCCCTESGFGVTHMREPEWVF